LNGIKTIKRRIKKMNVDRMALAFAVIFIPASFVLSKISSSYWFLFTAFVGRIYSRNPSPVSAH